jgi:hypothetical protein
VTSPQQSSHSMRTSGYMVGDFGGEIFCPPGWGCTMWNPDTQQWEAANNGPQQGSWGTITKMVDTFSRITHPLDVMAVNASFFLAGGGAIIAGGAAIGLGCTEPTPAEPLTCAAGIAGGAPTIVGGTLLLNQGVNFFKSYTLPAIENWGSE